MVTYQVFAWLLLTGLSLPLEGQAALSSENILANPSFETGPLNSTTEWHSMDGSERPPSLSTQQTHNGKQALSIPPNSAIEQKVTGLQPGAYLFHCWVHSDDDQSITVVIQNPTHPASAYTYADLKVTKGHWSQVEAFCAVEFPGDLTVSVGGMSSEFRRYHGGTSEMRNPVVIDDCELIRYVPKLNSAQNIWQVEGPLANGQDISTSTSWKLIQDPNTPDKGNITFQDGNLFGQVHSEDGSLYIYAQSGNKLQFRGKVAPDPKISAALVTATEQSGKHGISVQSKDKNLSYTIWLAPNGVIDLEPRRLTQLHLQEWNLKHGILPSFVGTDLCFTPAKLPQTNIVSIPSSQWFVGLRAGEDSLLTAVFPSRPQSISLQLSGNGSSRVIDGIAFSTESGGVSIALEEHAHLWHELDLNEDWLGEYVPITWDRPFPARWMAHFFVSPGGKAAFRAPYMSYSFPIADAKTRMWGVWFEDWNHYPFFFEGSRLIGHFEKTFIPSGKAVIYSLQSQASDLLAPCDVVRQVLGREAASSLFDFDANQLRRLHYSTPNEFVYDRPVCATTTRLSGIKKEEKSSVGLNLATHLFEFIREIRGRVDQYVAFFDGLQNYLEAQAKASPEAHAYIQPLQALIKEAQTRSVDIYKTPLSSVESKIQSMKQQLREGKTDGFDCGALDVRSPAGAQDDLCRRYNRTVLRLIESSAMECGDSPVKAAIASHIWQESRQILKQPTRWEPRRSLYFFEP